MQRKKRPPARGVTMPVAYGKRECSRQPSAARFNLAVFPPGFGSAARMQILTFPGYHGSFSPGTEIGSCQDPRLLWLLPGLRIHDLRNLDIRIRRCSSLSGCYFFCYAASLPLRSCGSWSRGRGNGFFLSRRSCSRLGCCLLAIVKGSITVIDPVKTLPGMEQLGS